ncbi:hypothetical protein AGMMS4957_07200 [Bacteroidia bacterium]|nr:hypothetical protein AGMMS4957_07200 [Bacteroidia bacterium]
MMEQKNEQRQTQTAAETPEKNLPFFAVGALFIALSLFLSFAPGVIRSWGLNYIAFFDPWVIGLFYVLLVCFWLPQTNQWLVTQITALSKTPIISFLGRHRYVLFAVLSLVAVGIFRLLRIKYILLGDLAILPLVIERGEIYRNEYLTMWSIGQLYKHFNFTGVDAVRLVDDIAGGLFVFFALCTANLLGNTFLKRAAAFIISTLSCTILLQFCGYTEIYAVPVLFLQLYLFTSLLCLKDKIHIAVPAFILLLGIAFHLLLVALLPSLVFLFYGKVLWKHPFFRSRKTICGLAVLSLPVVYFAFQKFLLPAMLPLEAADGMTVFSIAHFKEFFNSQLLGGGIGFLIWLMILVYSIVFKLKYNLMSWFFLVASLTIVGMMFVFDNARGSGDWDIYSFAAVVFNLSNAGVLMGGGVQEERVCKNLQYGMLMLAGFSVLHTSAWLSLNKTDASIKWVEFNFATEPMLRGDNAFVLGDALSGNNLAEALKWYDKSYREGNSKAGFKYVALLEKLGRNEEALKWCEQRYSEGDHAAGLKYTLLLQKLGRNEEHLIITEKQYKEDKGPATAHNYANTLLVQLDRKEEACAILEENIKEYPAYPPSYLLLIEVYIEKPDYDALYLVLIQMEQAYKQFPEGFTRRVTQERLDAYWGALAELRTMRAARR